MDLYNGTNYPIYRLTYWTSGLVRNYPLSGHNYAHIISDPTSLETWTPEDVSKWKNLNTFTAKLTSLEFSPWLNFPI